MARALQSATSGLSKDLTNLTSSGQSRIEDIISSFLLQDGHIKPSLITSIPVVDVFTVANETERLALTAAEGDYATQTDDGSQWIYNGTDWLHVSGTTLLSSLLDTNITAPQDRNLLTYSTSEGKWKNNTITTSDLTNVDIISPQAGDILVYDTPSSTWINSNQLLNACADTNILTPQSSDLLRYTAGKWTNYPDSNYATQSNLTTHTSNANIHRSLPDPSDSNKIVYTSGSNYILQYPDLNLLQDVTISTPQTGDLLQYNGSVFTNIPKNTNKEISVETVDRPLVLADKDKILLYPNSTSLVQFSLSAGIFSLGDTLTFATLNQLGSIRVILDGVVRIDNDWRTLTFKKFAQLICLGSELFKLITTETLTDTMYSITDLGSFAYLANSTYKANAYYSTTSFVNDVVSEKLLLNFYDGSQLRYLSISPTGGGIINNLAVAGGYYVASNFYDLGFGVYTLEVKPNVDSTYTLRLRRTTNNYSTSTTLAIVSDAINYCDNLIFDMIQGTICILYHGSDSKTALFKATFQFDAYAWYTDGIGITSSTCSKLMIGFHQSRGVVLLQDNTGKLYVSRDNFINSVWPLYNTGTSPYVIYTTSLTGYTLTHVKQQKIDGNFYFLASSGATINLWTLSIDFIQFINLRSFSLQNIVTPLEAELFGVNIYIFATGTSLPNTYVGRVLLYDTSTGETKIITNATHEIATNNSDTPIYLLLRQCQSYPGMIKINSTGTTSNWKMIRQLVF